MAGLLDILNGNEAAGEEKLDAKEQREFDEITYDKIQAISDPKKLARLEAYMRREEFFTTADVARARLQSLTSSSPNQEAPVVPARKSSDSELDQVLKELKSWEASVKGADKALKQDAAGPSEDGAAPIRRQVGGKVDKAGLIEEPETLKPKNAKEVVEKAKRMKDSEDVRSGAEYYKKWDKVADQLQEEQEGPMPPKKDEKKSEEKPVEEAREEDEDRSSTATLSAAAADRLVEAAWKKPAVEREWLATREREKGNELFKSQEYRSSLVSYSLAIRLQPTSAAAYANRAAAHLKLKQFKEACADCDKALEIDPHYLKALRRRGTASIELGQYESAVADLEAVQKVDPENKEIADLLRKARSKGDKKKPLKRMQIEEVEGDEEATESEKPKAVENKSSTNGGPDRKSLEEPVTREQPEGQASKGDQNVENRSGEEKGVSQKAETKAEAQNESSSQKEVDVKKLAEEWREKGNVLYKRGDTTGAAACYTHSLTYSKSAAALSNRAMCWNKIGKFKEAEEDASAALALDGTFVKAYHRRAAARQGLNKKQLAMEDYKVVLQAMPTNVALQEEVRSLQEELDETMYIPPRKGAMVIEEVAEEEPQPAVRPDSTFSGPQEQLSQDKPAAVEEQKQEQRPFDGVRTSSEKVQRVSSIDANLSREASQRHKQAAVNVSVSRNGKLETATEKEADSDKDALNEMEGAGTGKRVLSTDLSQPASEAAKQESEPPNAESDGREEAEKAKEEGNRLFKQKDVPGALKYYTRAIELQPKNAAFYGNRAMCYLQLKKYAEVIIDASKAIELDPQYTKAYYRRALAKKGLGQYESALEDLKFVQEKLPKDKQVAEEVLAITDLYMRRFENLASPSISEQGASLPAETSPPQNINQHSLAEDTVETKTEAAEQGEASKRGLPTWLKEQLEEQVKQGALKLSKDSAEITPLDSKDQPSKIESTDKPTVRESVGSLTDDIFGSKQDRPAFSVGSFDKKASPSKTSPRGKRRAFPRSVVSGVTESQTPPNEIKEEGPLEEAKGSLKEQEPPTKKQPRVEAARVEKKGVEEQWKLSSTTKAEAATKPMPAVPRSALEFERACSSLNEPDRIAAYLQTIDPSSYPAIIKENLSAQLMTHIAKALPVLPAKTAADVMGGLSDVSRFALVWMLLPAATKKNFAAVLKGSTPDLDATPAALERLKKAFRT